MSQSLHNGLKTSWVDFPLHDMPRFGMKENVIHHTTLPQRSTNSSHENIRLDPSQDLKISLAFADNKLLTPWIKIYDANNRRSLKRLVVKFTHDEFEVVRLDLTTIYGPKIARLDPSHPALRGFEITYMWENVQEEDFGFGVISLFITSVVAFLTLFCLVIFSSDSNPAWVAYNTHMNGGKSRNKTFQTQNVSIARGPQNKSLLKQIK
eukprot:gene14601-19608_t